MYRSYGQALNGGSTEVPLLLGSVRPFSDRALGVRLPQHRSIRESLAHTTGLEQAFAVPRQSAAFDQDLYGDRGGLGCGVEM